MPDESVSDQLSETLARMGAVLFSDQTLDAILQLVVSLAVESVDSVDAASITLRRAGAEETTNASSESAIDVDEAQYASGRGPCLTAARTGQRIIVDIEPGDQRWPEYADAAAAQGFRGSISLPLFIGDEPTGALNVYAGSEEAFAERHLRALALFSEQATVVLSNALAFTRAEMINEHLEAALATRETIGQAKGILMAREGVGPEEAFDILRRASQRANRKLRDVAQDIVTANHPGTS